MYKRTQTDRIDVQRLRDVLEDAQISQKKYAKACKLSETWITLVLNGHRKAGELGAIKMRRGLSALGLPQDCITPEVCHV